MSQLISDIRSRDQRTSFSNKRQSDGVWLGLGLGRFPLDPPLCDELLAQPTYEMNPVQTF